MSLLSITDASIAYMCLGGFLVALSMFSVVVKESIFINEVVLGTIFGIIIGPYCAGIFDPRSWGNSNSITLEVMRVVLAVGLFSVGIDLPKSYLAQHAKSLLIMVVPTMAIGWVIVAGLIKVAVPRLNFVSSLAISACLTPTDPIICASIVGGTFARKYVPVALRQILSAESAANDGLAYPFVSLALYLTLDMSRGVAFTHWVSIGWLYQVVLGTLLGALIGLVMSRCMKFCYKHGFINQESYVIQYISLALLVTGIINSIGSDDLLGAFAAGSAISWDGDFKEHVEGETFAPVFDFILNCACFVYIGAWIPFESFTMNELGMNPRILLLLTFGIMVLRRIPPLLMLYKWVPEVGSWQQALFSGHFGPEPSLSLLSPSAN